METIEAHAIVISSRGAAPPPQEVSVVVEGVVMMSLEWRQLTTLAADAGVTARRHHRARNGGSEFAAVDDVRPDGVEDHLVGTLGIRNIVHYACIVVVNHVIIVTKFWWCASLLF